VPGLAQELNSPAPPVLAEQAVRAPGASCLEPAPLITLDQYQGPFQKVVGVFYETLDRKSVHEPHYKAGALLCSLETKDKFALFIHDAFDPLSFMTAGFFAGLDQAQNNDPSYGQGAAGYGKRFGADFTDQTTLRFFTDFAYPTIFSEDPRYYRLAHGSTRQRFFHAVGHTFVAHRDDGRHMFNYSEWLGVATAAAMSNAYHRGNERGFGPSATRAGYALGTEMGFDVVREFWPEIARKLRMPFRDHNEPGPTN
jgi:hypothetical protein